MSDHGTAPVTDRSQALTFLRRSLANASADFRPGQWESIDALVNGQARLLLVQRTGWGKSAVYFIATRILRDRGRGPTLIVSPLLALMRNQIEAARRLGIRALTINSTNREDWPQYFDSIRRNEADALLISPERLANDEFVTDVLLPLANSIGMIVVDEAHCISDWGHDFRPDYRRIVRILRRIPLNLPVLATTATANDRVVDDIRSQLGNIDIQRGPLMRDSLMLGTLRLPDQASRLAWLAQHLPTLPGTGIVYTLTKRDTELVANWLRQQGITAYAYYSDAKHPDFPDANAYRQHAESLLLSNRIKALVATTALGMGYDKPDLGFVIHYQAPGSTVAYYQQVGRAGRAIENAYGILLAGREDDEIHDYFRRTAFPSQEAVAGILDALESADGMSARQLEAALNLRHSQIEQAIKFLAVEDPSPVLKDGPKWKRTPVEYELPHDCIERLTHMRESEWQELQNYVDSMSCLMVRLAHALDDTTTEPCGRCSVCRGRPVVPTDVDRDIVIRATRYLRISEFPLDARKQVAAGAFEVYGWRGNLPGHLHANEGRVLSRWGDAGWGRAVADDKHAGRFRDDLVEAVAEMIRDRWRPDPPPAWITCVPSLTHPMLVPDFAHRIAARLGLPFVEAVRKIRQNQPQKAQQNRYHQCRNLDGAFSIEGAIPPSPVLLLDDIVDSGWTLTVIAALLRDAGSGPVWPVALAAANAGE